MNPLFDLASWRARFAPVDRDSPSMPGVAPVGDGSEFTGTVADVENGNVRHWIQVSVDHRTFEINGTSHWPENLALGLEARQFALRGTAKPDGELVFADNAPERAPGFRRGVYVGRLNPASGHLGGQYGELDESTNEWHYFGDWTASR